MVALAPHRAAAKRHLRPPARGRALRHLRRRCAFLRAVDVGSSQGKTRSAVVPPVCIVSQKMPYGRMTGHAGRLLQLKIRQLHPLFIRLHGDPIRPSPGEISTTLSTHRFTLTTFRIRLHREHLAGPPQWLARLGIINRHQNRRQAIAFPEMT